MANKLLAMGEYDASINEALGINIKPQTIFRSTGLPSHMIKRKHYKALKYIDSIPDIIKNPDYVGLHKNKDETYSVEYIKTLKLNILVAVKIDYTVDYLYVSTVHDIQDSKIQRRLCSKKIKPMLSESNGATIDVEREESEVVEVTDI